jgi:hypothetical protein
MESRKRQRSGSPPSVTQPPEKMRIPEGKLYIEYRTPGGARMLRTARKRVPCHTTIKIKSRQPGHDFEPTVDSNSDPETEETILGADSDAESETLVTVHLAFDPHPDHELWERFRELYLY